MISVQNAQDKISINKKQIAKKASRVLKSLKKQNCDLSIILVDNNQIKRLNKEYLNKKHSTDVLAFSMKEGKALRGDEKLLGDIAICVEKARMVARATNISLEKEIDLYLVHGILHLLGYRDKTEKERASLFKKQEKLTGLLWKEEV